jgi:hypothetical protein
MPFRVRVVSILLLRDLLCRLRCQSDGLSKSLLSRDTSRWTVAVGEAASAATSSVNFTSDELKWVVETLTRVQTLLHSGDAKEVAAVITKLTSSGEKDGQLSAPLPRESWRSGAR